MHSKSLDRTAANVASQYQGQLNLSTNFRKRRTTEISVIYDAKKQHLSALKVAVFENLEAHHSTVSAEDPQLHWLLHHGEPLG